MGTTEGMALQPAKTKLEVREYLNRGSEEKYIGKGSGVGSGPGG